MICTFAFKFEKNQGYSLKTTRSLTFLRALFIKRERDGGKKGKEVDKEHGWWPTDVDNSVGTDCGSGGGVDRGGSETTIIE